MDVFNAGTDKDPTRTTMKQIASFITQEREKRGISQRQLARMSNVSSATISRFESGNVLNLNLESVYRILRSLGYTLRWHIDYYRGDDDPMLMILSRFDSRGLPGVMQELPPDLRDTVLRYARDLLARHKWE